MSNTIGRIQADELQRLRELLGESTFQRIQRDTWKQFSPKAPPINSQGNMAPLALFGIWDELVLALREAAKRPAREQEAASRLRAGGQLWELQKKGVKWSATLKFQSNHQGWEVVIARNGQRSHAQHFISHNKAEAWADKECAEIAMGWRK